MKTRELLRIYKDDRTIGKLDGFKTLERPWLDNQFSVSCIPEGEYIVERDHYGRFQYYRLKGTEPRTSIEMHGGVYPHHSEGCILLGQRHNENFDLVGSDDALIEFLQEQGEESFILNIRQYNPTKDGDF